MISSSALNTIAGRTVHGAGGEKIGKIVDVYESTDADDGTFVSVSTGLFGGHASFVPLAQASLRGDDVVVPYDKDLVKHAPRVEADEELTSTEEDRLYQHYGLGGGATTATTATTTSAATTATTATAPAVGHDTSGPTTDGAMTRSEERLQVGVQRTEAGRARLRKRIVTEDVHQTVAVSSERATVVREPITGGNMPAAMDGPALSEEEHEVVLRGEEVVVAKETVPVERVRLDTATVSEQQTVSSEVRKEQIEVDDSELTGRRGTDRR